MKLRRSGSSVSIAGLFLAINSRCVSALLGNTMAASRSPWEPATHTSGQTPVFAAANHSRENDLPLRSMGGERSCDAPNASIAFAMHEYAGEYERDRRNPCSDLNSVRRSGRQKCERTSGFFFSRGSQLERVASPLLECNLFFWPPTSGPMWSGSTTLAAAFASLRLRSAPFPSSPAP
jgi:hypothetical protein